MSASEGRNSGEAAAPRGARWWAHALLWAYLFSPLVLELALRGGAERFDRLYVFNLLTSVLWAGLLVTLARRQWLLHWVLAPLYFTTAVDDFLLLTYGARLSSGYIGIVLTDYAEAGEFLMTFALPVAVSAVALAVVYALGLAGLGKAVTVRRPRLAWVCASLLMFAYAGSVGRTIYLGTPPRQAALEAVGKETSVPFGVLFQTALAAYMHVDARELRARRAQFRFGAKKGWSEPGELYVLVVGESSRPHNWGLLGYARDTTPRLAAMPDLIVLRDLLTTSPATSVAVPSMLSLRTIADWPSVQAEKSIVGAFGEAGLKTFWLSAQAADSWGGLIPYLAAEAGYRRYFDRGYDGELLGAFRELLGKHAPGERMFFVLHTKGSHWRYARRYPAQFARFESPSGNNREQLVGAYDSSVLYTDWLLAEIIATLRARGGAGAVVYASDHGENLLDDPQQLLGHVVGNHYDLPTVGVLWLSPRLRERHADRLAALSENARQPLSLSNIAPTLLDLAGIEAAGLDRAMSLISERFAPKERYYLLHGKLRVETPPRAGEAGALAGGVRP